SLRRRVADCGNPRESRDQMDRHVASLLAMTGGGKSSWPASPNGFGVGPSHVASLLPYKTRLSLRRRAADCGNPRESRDQKDRHVASLLAMTGGGKSSWPSPPRGSALVRPLATTDEIR